MATIGGVIKEISAAELMPSVLEIKQRGLRLTQICSTRLEDGYELYYSFTDVYELETLKLTVATDEEVPSISAVYAPAFLYENEVKELFGVNIKMISLDFQNKLYRIDEEAPFKTRGEAKK